MITADDLNFLQDTAETLEDDGNDEQARELRRISARVAEVVATIRVGGSNPQQESPPPASGPI